MTRADHRGQAPWRILPGFLLVLTGCAERSSRSEPNAWFVEEAVQRGIEFRYESGFDKRALIPEIIGGGAALADLDGDGDLDAYLVQSGWNLAAGPPPNAPANRLFINRGDGHFESAKEMGQAGDRVYGMGVAAGDYDNDGDIDLYVTNLGPNVLLRNDGTGRFEDQTAAAGVGDPGWGTAATFADLDRDGDLDLFVVNYLNWTLAIEKDCFHRGAPTNCSPTGYETPAMDRLYRNDGDGSFTDITIEAGMNRGFGNGLGTVAEDFNDDGLLDLFVANDGLVDQLWINQGGLRFEDEAEAWGCAVDDHGVAKAGMGVAAADVDNDGDADLLVVNLNTETDSFYRNEGGYFIDVTARAGIATPSRQRTRFGVALADFDNDGLLDLYEANGKIDGDPAAVPDTFAEPNTLYRGRNDGAGWVEFETLEPEGGVAAPLVYTSRALAVGDVDDDGGLDLLVVNREGPAHLLMNQVAGRGGWVRFRVVTESGRDALGARLSVRIGSEQRHWTVRADASYLAANDPRVHFGLGSESGARGVTVRWVDGAVEAFGDFESGREAELRRGRGQVVSPVEG